MRIMTWIVVTGMALTVAGASGADNSTDTQAIIDRALQAAGGVERLTQPRAYSFKQEMTAKSKQNPVGTVTKTTYHVQPPKQFRLEEESSRGGRVSKYVEVINGARGWAKRDGMPVPVPPQSIRNPAEVQQGFGDKFILVLRDRASTATMLGESKVDGRAVVGVKLVRPVGRGSEERRLYFDAQTNLLAKSDLHAKLSTGAELATTEQTWSDYRTIDGIAVPHRVTHAIKDRAGSTFERVYSDFQFVDKLDPDLFKGP